MATKTTTFCDAPDCDASYGPDGDGEELGWWTGSIKGPRSITTTYLTACSQIHLIKAMIEGGGR